MGLFLLESLPIKLLEVQLQTLRGLVLLSFLSHLAIAQRSLESWGEHLDQLASPRWTSTPLGTLLLVDSLRTRAFLVVHPHSRYQ
jgi:hypothetical protein